MIVNTRVPTRTTRTFAWSALLAVGIGFAGLTAANPSWISDTTAAGVPLIGPGGGFDRSGSGTREPSGTVDPAKEAPTGTVTAIDTVQQDATAGTTATERGHRLRTPRR